MAKCSCTLCHREQRQRAVAVSLSCGVAITCLCGKRSSFRSVWDCAGSQSQASKTPRSQNQKLLTTKTWRPFCKSTVWPVIAQTTFEQCRLGDDRPHNAFAKGAPRLCCK